jgi:hypothetical protein
LKQHRQAADMIAVGVRNQDGVDAVEIQSHPLECVTARFAGIEKDRLSGKPQE